MPAKISTIIANPEPFGPPTGIRHPLSAFCGSLVGLPSLSRAQSRGIFSFLRAAILILPLATTDDDISSITGISEEVGTAKAIGLDPRKGSAPPYGAMEGFPFVIMMAAIFCMAALCT